MIEKGLLGGASCWQAKILLSPPAGVQFSRQYYCTFYTVSVADHSMVGTVPLVLAPDHAQTTHMSHHPRQLREAVLA